MATFYAITVFVVVKWWNKPVLAPRNTKYFIIAIVFVWVLAILLAGLIFPSNVITIFYKTTSTEVNDAPLDAASLSFILVSLLLPVCNCLSHQMTNHHRKQYFKKCFTKIMDLSCIWSGNQCCWDDSFCPVVFLALSTQIDANLVVMVIITLLLILTPNLICIFFKPVQLKLKT